MPSAKTKPGFKRQSQREKMVDAQKGAEDGLAAQRAGTFTVVQRARDPLSNSHIAAASGSQSPVPSAAVDNSTSAAPVKA
jgi:hypothetical protein